MKRILVFLVLLLLIGCSKAPVQEPVAAEPVAAPVVAEPVAAPVVAEPVEDAVVAPVVTEAVIQQKSFDPETLTVTKGTEITWKNTDDRKKTLMIRPGDIKSPSIKPDETYSYTFETEGEYTVLEITTGTKGTVVVN